MLGSKYLIQLPTPVNKTPEVQQIRKHIKKNSVIELCYTLTDLQYIHLTVQNIHRITLHLFTQQRAVKMYFLTSVPNMEVKGLLSYGIGREIMP